MRRRRRIGSRGTSFVAVVGLSAGLMLGGCEALLGTGSLEDRVAEGGSGDGTVGPEGGGDTGADVVAQESGAESGADGTVKDGATEGSTGDATGTDATGSDAHDAGGDSTTTTEAGTGDSGGTDSGSTESGTDSGGADGGGVDAAPEAAPTLSCGLVGADQRQVNAAGATISADGLVAINAGQSSVIALALTASPPSLVYQMRADRPADAPNAFPLQGPSASPAKLQGVTRSTDNTATYLFGADQAGNALLWSWPDSNNPSSTPTAVAPRSPVPGAGQTIATSKGIFYAVTGSAGSFADYQVPPALPSIVVANQISTIGAGMTDGQRGYRLSDDRVSLVYTDTDGFQHQNEYAANSATKSSSRVYYTGGMIPYTFQPNGSNVDVGAVIFPADASVPSIATATIPESQLFSFDPGATLKPVTLPSSPSNTWCLTSYPGKMIFLAPTTAGMDLLVIDVATATLTYSLTGAANLVHSDTAIVNCSISHPTIAGNTMTFDVLWTDNAGGGPQNLEFAPLQCTLQ
jgi:hypothetical protein